MTLKEKTIHTQGLVGVLKELHDELNAAVLQAYSLAPGLDTDALLTHLVGLNARRATEEKAGHICWLRPEFQNPATPGDAASLSNQELSATVTIGLQADLILETAVETASAAVESAQQPWPSTLPEQVRVVAQVLASAASALTLPAIEARFKGRGAWKKGLPRILETLEVLARIRREGEGWRG